VRSWHPARIPTRHPTPHPLRAGRASTCTALPRAAGGARAASWCSSRHVRCAHPAGRRLRRGLLRHLRRHSRQPAREQQHSTRLPGLRVHVGRRRGHHARAAWRAGASRVGPGPGATGAAGPARACRERRVKAAS
jgi:hypothetical protein